MFLFLISPSTQEVNGSTLENGADAGTFSIFNVSTPIFATSSIRVIKWRRNLEVFGNAVQLVFFKNLNFFFAKI